MSLDRFSNKDEILSTSGIRRGISWKKQDVESLGLSLKTITTDGTNEVEIHVYAPDGTYINSTFSNSFKFDGNKLYVNYLDALNELGIRRGQFELVTNVHEPIFGSYNERILTIKQISTDRREILVGILPTYEDKLDSYYTIVSDYLAEFSNTFSKDLAINLDKNRIIKIINQKSWSDDPTQFVIRLYQELPIEFEIGNSLWIVEELIDPYTDNVEIVFPLPEDPVNKLRGPNFAIDPGFSTITETEFKNWNTLLDASLGTSQKVIDSIFSGSLGSIPIGIDYTAFDNYVFYSSAYERVANFKYKLELIEHYSASISTLETAQAGNVDAFAGNIVLNQKRIDNIVGSFDGFERWLYNEPTSSLSTHGISGSVLENDAYVVTPWPKYLASGSYVLHKTTSTIANNWFATASYNAQFYDELNENALTKTIPEHIRRDSGNNQYELFVNMIGHHFDILYTHIEALTRLRIPEEQPKLSVNKDTLFELAKSMGWSLANGNQASSLWKYKLGTDSVGKYQSTGSLFSKSNEEITTEVWRRIVNNLPYLLKTKGTDRSVRALMSCYGIPSTLLSVREYGGPAVSGDAPNLIDDRFSYMTPLGNIGEYTPSNASTKNPGYVYYNLTPNLSTAAYFTGPNGSYLDSYDSITNTVLGSFGLVLQREMRFKTLGKEPASGSFTNNAYTTLPKRDIVLWGLDDSSTYHSTGNDRCNIVLQYYGSYQHQSGNSTITFAANSYWKDLPSGSLYSGSADYGRIVYTWENSVVATDWLPLFDGDVWNMRWWYDYNYGRTYLQVQKASDFIRGRVSHRSTTGYLTVSDQNRWQGGPWVICGNGYGGGPSTDVRENASPWYLHLNAGNDGYIQRRYGWSAGVVTLQDIFIQEFREWLETQNQATFDDHTLNPTSYSSTRSITGSYDLLVRHYPFGSDTLIPTTGSSQPNRLLQAANKNTIKHGLNLDSGSGEFYTKTTELYPLTETYYTEGVSLGGNLPRSQKIRIEDNYLIRRLSPTNTAERSSFDYAPLDSNKLGLFYSITDHINKDIFNEIGNAELDAYIGDPDDEFELSYKDLESVSYGYWKKYENPNDVNAFIRVLSQLDFSLFSQIKQLIPARANTAMGLLIEPHALERAKVQLTKRIKVENPQYDGDLSYPQILTGEHILYSASIDRLLPIEAEHILYSASIVDTRTLSSEYILYSASISGLENVIHIESLYHSGSSNGYVDLGNTWYAEIPRPDANIAIESLYHSGSSNGYVDLGNTWYGEITTARNLLVESLYHSGSTTGYSDLGNTWYGEITTARNLLVESLYHSGSSNGYADLGNTWYAQIARPSQTLDVQSLYHSGSTTGYSDLGNTWYANIQALQNTVTAESIYHKVGGTGSYNDIGNTWFANTQVVNGDPSDYSQINNPVITPIPVTATSSIYVPIENFTLVTTKSINGANETTWQYDYNNSYIITSANTIYSRILNKNYGAVDLNATAQDGRDWVYVYTNSNSSPGEFAAGSSTPPLRWKFDYSLQYDTLSNVNVAITLLADMATIANVVLYRLDNVDGSLIRRKILHTNSNLNSQIFGTTQYIMLPAILFQTNTMYELELIFQVPIGGSEGRFAVDQIALSLRVLEVWHSAVINPIVTARPSSIYKKLVNHYSSSVTNVPLMLRNAIHFYSQSLNDYYSQSLATADYRDDPCRQLENLRWRGTQITAPDYNLPVSTKNTAIEGTPVIEVYETNPNQLIFTKDPESRGNTGNNEPGNLLVE